MKNLRIRNWLISGIAMGTCAEGNSPASISITGLKGPIRLLTGMSRERLFLNALSEVGCFVGIVSVNSLSYTFLHLGSRPTALFDTRQVVWRLEQSDGVGEFTTALRQRSHRHIPGELHRRALSLDEHVRYGHQVRMLFFRNLFRPVLHHQSGANQLYIDRNALTVWCLGSCTGDMCG